MSARNTRTNSAGDAENSTNTEAANAASLLADLPRRQMALVSQAASALYRGSEAVRQVQQDVAKRATDRHQEAAEKLREARDFSEVMAIQTELLRYDLQESAQYWQQVTTALLKVQAEMITGAGEMLDPSAAEPTLDSLQRAFAATLNGSAAVSSNPQ